jgi:hypothetical protein
MVVDLVALGCRHAVAKRQLLGLIIFNIFMHVLCINTKRKCSNSPAVLKRRFSSQFSGPE